MKNKLHLFYKKNKRWTITHKMFLSLFVTGTIIEVSQVGAAFIDSLITSRYLGTLAMAAAGIVFPIFSIFGIISGLLAIGMQVRCSQAIGRGDKNIFCQYISLTIYIGIATSLIITILVILLNKWIPIAFGAYGNAADLVDQASSYVLGIAFGIPGSIMTNILASAHQLDSGRKTVRYGALAGIVCNILVAIVSIKLNWGLFGIGLAWTFGNYINMVILFLFYLKKDRIFHYVKPKISLFEYLHALSNGSEMAFKRIANTLRPIVLNVIIIYYGGSSAMSILSIRNSLADMADIFGAGLASAVALLVGFYYGEINKNGIKEVDSFKRKMIVVFPGAVCIILLIFARQLANLYITGNDEILPMVEFSIRMLALQVPLQALITARIKYLQAIEKKFNMILLIWLAKFICIIPVALILSQLFGVYGILSCFTVSDAITLVLVYIWYAIKEKKIFLKMPVFLNLSDRFYIHPGDIIHLDIRDDNDVSLVAEQIMSFCKGHHINQKIAFHAALVFEELTSIIIRNGRLKNRFQRSVMADIRCVISDNNFIIRIQDNCLTSDITKILTKTNEKPNNPKLDISIRIINKIVSEIIYLNTFDTNNIIVKLDTNTQE